MYIGCLARIGTMNYDGSYSSQTLAGCCLASLGAVFLSMHSDTKWAFDRFSVPFWPQIPSLAKTDGKWSKSVEVVFDTFWRFLTFSALRRKLSKICLTLFDDFWCSWRGHLSTGRFCGPLTFAGLAPKSITVCLVNTSPMNLVLKCCNVSGGCVTLVLIKLWHWCSSLVQDGDPTITTQNRVRDEEVYKTHFSTEFGRVSVENVGELGLNSGSRTKFANLLDFAMRWWVGSTWDSVNWMWHLAKKHFVANLLLWGWSWARALLKVTDPRWRTPTNCAFLRFLAQIFGLWRFYAVSCALQMLEFPRVGKT